MKPVLNEETLFKDIFTIPPASILAFDGNKLSIKKYWEIKSGYPVYPTEEKYIAILRGLLEDAVYLHSKVEVPFGLFLSGGLDSSLIAYIAKPKHVFFCHFEYDGDSSELAYAQLVAKDIGAELHVVKPEANDFKKYYEKIIWHLDQPIATASTISSFLLAREASKFVKVILNGEGADELFGGYVRYLLMLIENRLSKAPELSHYHSLARFFWNKEMFHDLPERYFVLTKRGVAQSAAPFNKIKEIFSRHSQLIDKMCACDMEITLPSLLMMGDRVAAAFGLENRAPFLDHRLVEFAFSLPAEMKIKDTQTKYILRKVAKGIVPAAIIERKDKRGLTTPIAQWFSADLFDWTNSLVERFKKRKIEFKSGDYRGEYDRYLYTLISLELWFEIFIDRQCQD